MATGSYSLLKLLEDNIDVADPIVIGGAVVICVGALALLGLKLLAIVKSPAWAARRTQKKIAALRREGKLTGEFTYSDAVQLVQTGTLSPKPLPQMVRDTAPVLRWLYDDDEHGAMYQYEMGGVSLRNIDEAMHAAEAVGQHPLVKILRETRALFEEFDRVHAESRARGEDSQMDWYEGLYDRARQIADRYRSFNSSGLYADAAVRYLSREHAHLLPLP